MHPDIEDTTTYPGRYLAEQKIRKVYRQQFSAIFRRARIVLMKNNFPHSLPQLEITIKLYGLCPRKMRTTCTHHLRCSSEQQFFQTNYKQKRCVSLQRHTSLNETNALICRVFIKMTFLNFFRQTINGRDGFRSKGIC